MNNFGQIVTNVGVRVGDTSSAFATQIKKYVNFRYKEIWERFNWGTINPSYTITTSNGTADYKLPDDYWKALYVFDTTNNIDVSARSLQDLEREFTNRLADSGNPIRYAIYDKMNESTPTPTGEIETYIRFYPTPSSAMTMLMPYQLKPSDMSDDADLPILDCDYEVELGATAEAWRTKRQFAKAADFDRQYEQHIQHMIWRRENDPNRIVQFTPQTMSREGLY